MKYLHIVFALVFSINAFAQGEGDNLHLDQVVRKGNVLEKNNTWQKEHKNDTLKPKCQILNSGWKKHNHILDYRFYFLYEADNGAIGYTYLYKPFEKWKFGARVGYWGRSSRDDIPPASATKAHTFTGSLLVNYSLWKSVNLQLRSGFDRAYSVPQPSNITHPYSYWRNTFFEQSLAVNTIWAKYFVFNVEYGYYYDSIPKKGWSNFLVFSLGFKF